jgi:signal transduction histidine kinase
MLRRRAVELAWVAFAALNFAAMPLTGEWETIPFHFVWVSLTLLYGFRVWRPSATTGVLTAVIAVSGLVLTDMSIHGQVSPAEMTEVPLMSAMFVAMVWHARRRQAAMEELRRVTERERDFVRDASHELRTPITIARGHAELLRAASVSDEALADADVVLDELSRLERIAERLLLLAAVEHPGFLRRIPVEVDVLVGETARRWSASALRRWTVDVDAKGWVPADAERLSYALDALIENAVKVTDEGGAIALRTFRLGDAAVIEVRDDGPGIPSANAERVFERFARANGGGTGLGLPIVKAIVQAHGGGIVLESRAGEGAAFRILLPGFRPEPQSGAAMEWPLDAAA